MSEGTFICTNRVERDGRLVAFEGEVMTMEEAATRGLLGAEPEPEKTRAEWLAEAEELGIDVPKRASTAKVRALVEEARR